MITQPNYTQCPNRILDNIKEFTPAEFCCLMYLARVTLGWHKQTITVGTRTIAQAVGMTHQHISTQLKNLEAKGWITKKPSTNPQKAPTYTLNILATGDDTEEGGVSTTVATGRESVSTTVATLKENKSLNKKHIANLEKTQPKPKSKSPKNEKNMRAKPKNTSPKEQFEDIDLPSGVSRELWISFLSHRRELRKGVTKQSCKRLVAKLFAAGPRANELLSKALENGWIGLDVSWLRSPSSRSSQELEGGDRANRNHPDWRPVRGQRVEFKERTEEALQNTQRNELEQRARELMQRLAVNNG